MLVKKIDIHVHTSESKWPSFYNGARYATPEELIEIYDKIGVEKGVLLPMILNEFYFQIASNYEIKLAADKHPDRFYWFCNIDPRQGLHSPETDFTPYIQACKEQGAKVSVRSAPMCTLMIPVPLICSIIVKKTICRLFSISEIKEEITVWSMRSVCRALKKHWLLSQI